MRLFLLLQLISISSPSTMKQQRRWKNSTTFCDSRSQPGSSFSNFFSQVLPMSSFAAAYLAFVSLEGTNSLTTNKKQHLRTLAKTKTNKKGNKQLLQRKLSKNASNEDARSKLFVVLSAKIFTSEWTQPLINQCSSSFIDKTLVSNFPNLQIFPLDGVFHWVVFNLHDLFVVLDFRRSEVKKS